ncbi:MAG: HNH endonuclease signature motif containing protein, partial [Agromyces sp.]
ADAARRLARQARDRIDAASVMARAEHQREAQFWRVWVKPDGMVRGEFELDAEGGMLVAAVFDQLTHPRRTTAPVRRGFGDPVSGDAAFVDARAARERDAAEGLVQLLRAGASVDPTRVLNDKKPSVRLVVNADSLRTGEGSGVIEGHPDRIPLTDIHTGLCEGYLPILFDAEGACLDLGRDERLFTDRQKAALAVRDGGCMHPGCTRPPSWTEAHHIDHWQRDGGRTDLADGILLCRRDHLRYHNQGWEVRRDDTHYWLIPPVDVDPEQTPRMMRPKTPADILNPVDPARLSPPSGEAMAAEPERLLSAAG